MAKPRRKTERVQGSRGNLFADLGLPDAEEFDTNARLS